MTGYRSLTACYRAAGIALFLAGSAHADSPPTIDSLSRYISVQPPHPNDEPQPARDPITAEVLNQLAAKPLRSISISLDPPRNGTGVRIPPDVALSIFQDAGDEYHDLGASRPWPETIFAWTATAIAHRPLYFEDESLERYGQHYGIAQPVVSAAHFFGRLPVIPYMVGATPPHERQYALGYYRPGECTPHFFTWPKPSSRGALFQGAAVAGGIFLIP